MRSVQTQRSTHPHGARVSPACRGVAAMNSACPRRVSPSSSLGLSTIPSPTLGVSSGDHPAVRRFGSAPIARSTGFVFRQQTRPATPTDSSSRRRPSRATFVTDWSFFPRLRDCAPPRVTTTQLRFDTARLFTAQRRTSTALSQRLPRRASRSLQAASPTAQE